MTDNAIASRYEELHLTQDQNADQSTQSQVSIPNLQRRCDHLLNELDYLTSYLASINRGDTIESRSFRSGIQSELKSLDRLAACTIASHDAQASLDIKGSDLDSEAAVDEGSGGTNGDRITHTLRSSNVPFYETVWSTAKRSKGIVAFSRRFYWSAPTRAEKRAARAPDTYKSSTETISSRDSATDIHERGTTGQERPVPNAKQEFRTPVKLSALVDIVANDGAEWIKVSTVTETRLLFELAKQGWERDEDSFTSEDDFSREGDARTWGRLADGSDDDSLRNDESDDEDEVSILRAARDLSRASRAHRVRYRHPHVRIVLPKITAGSINAIDSLLNNIRATGATIETSSDLLPSLPLPYTLALSVPDIPVADAISQGNLVSSPLAHLTDILNIDCTILLALVSDLSHARVDAEPWFHSAVKRQIEVEEKQTLLPSILYPVLKGRGLVCTDVAVKRMKEIVETIGTESEKARTELLIGKTREDSEEMEASLRTRWAELSDYDVPLDLRLPIRTVQSLVDPRLRIGAEATADAPQQPLPSLAAEVEANLSELNASVFLYSWRTGRTCVTSNRAVVKQIEVAIDRLSTECEERGEEIHGPRVWLCGAARSLVGKEKGRREG